MYIKYVWIVLDILALLACSSFLKDWLVKRSGVLRSWIEAEAYGNQATFTGLRTHYRSLSLRIYLFSILFIFNLVYLINDVRHLIG